MKLSHYTKIDYLYLKVDVQEFWIFALLCLALVVTLVELDGNLHNADNSPAVRVDAN